MRAYTPVPAYARPLSCDVCRQPAEQITKVRAFGHAWDACSDACAGRLERHEIDPGNPLAVSPHCVVVATRTGGADV